MGKEVITLIAIAIIAILWVIGGLKWRTLRIVGVPIVLGLDKSLL